MSPRRNVTWIISAGTEKVAVAAPSKRAAVAALNDAHRGWSMHGFNMYASHLRDDHPIAVMCLARPGVVFARDNRTMRDAWSVVSPGEEP